MMGSKGVLFSSPFLYAADFLKTVQLSELAFFSKEDLGTQNHQSFIIGDS
jgi:hypothetical protein